MRTIRYSRQRELVLQAVQSTDRHPTAEMVYQCLKKDNPGLSLGTVYRNLNYLSESGQIMRLNTPIERYDGNTNPHAHLRCTICGTVFDLDCPYDGALDYRVNDATPHLIRYHELMFYGTCAQCAAQAQGDCGNDEN